MAMVAEEVIGAIRAQPGQPIGQILGGQIVPLQGARRQTHGGYPTYDALAEEVARTLDHLHPELPVELRRLYRNAEGVWVRVVGAHSGETFSEKQTDGSTITWAARIWVERAVALTIEAARVAVSPEMDYFWAGKGWVRKGVKREWEDEQNVGSQARQSVQWERQQATSPSLTPRPSVLPYNGLPPVATINPPVQAPSPSPTQVTSAGLVPEEIEEPPPPPKPPARGSLQKEQ